MKVQFVLLFHLFFGNFLMASDFKPLIISEDATDFFVRNETLKYYIQPDTASLEETDLFALLSKFKICTDRNLRNTEIKNTYWLFFKIINKTKRENLVLELYDFNIDEVSLLLYHNRELQLENQAGYLSKFNSRILHHKNFSYPFRLIKNDTIDVFMKLKSSKISILNPVIKTRINHTKYTLKEYLLLGIFYGTLFLILVYNLVYFFILKEKTYLFYVFYLVFISFFFLSQDGIGFQYLWSEYPIINKYIETVSLTSSIIALLFFSKSFIKPEKYKLWFLYLAMTLMVILCFTDLFITKINVFRISLFVCFQICLFLGVIDKRKNHSKNRWYNLSFLLINVFYLIRLLESLDLISSSAFTVYSMNFGLVLQFISLSIGITENSKSIILEKNKALNELLNTRKENDALRLVELKRQMNPHFLFNALNSIQSRILVNNNKDASTLLLKFSQLLRKNLEISDVQFISFEDEIALLKNYLGIEKIRLGDSFNYKISVDSGIDINEEKIPTFLIQPLIENAIWHGFSKTKENQLIVIDITQNKNNIEISIYDNGIGISNTKDKETNNKTSKGLSIVNERLILIEKTFNKKVSLELISPYKKGETGTLAKITLWK